MNFLYALTHKVREATISAGTFNLVCITMACVVAVHASHLPVWLSLLLGFALLASHWRRRNRPGKTPMWLKLPLTLGLLAGIVVWYGNLFGREPGSAFAVGLLVLKTFECETARDVRVAVAFACFALMAALLSDQGLVVTVAVALSIVPALMSLRSLEPGQAQRSITQSALPALGLLAAALPLALLAFLFVPRLSEPLWGAPAPDTAKPGLSSSMSPGDLTELLTDDSAAMRVSFDGVVPGPDQRYFRAFVMWNFDGRRWDHGYGRRGEVAGLLPQGPVATYEITLEATHRRILPALDVPMAAPEGARLSADRELSSNDRIDDVRRYRLSSALGYSLQADLDDNTRRLGLQLPPNFDPRARALAQQWRLTFGQNDEGIARAALGLFHDGGFRYTLAPAPLGRDSIDDFLFNTREGFCEHYASAFTFLMRAAGIPARVVTGYQGGFFNRLGQYLLVRQSNAHAWSEVWLAGRGWVRFDPTGAVRPERIAADGTSAGDGSAPWYQPEWLQAVRNRWDIVNRLWAQGVTGFDALRQRSLLQPFGVREAPPSMLVTILASGICLLAAIGLGWALYRRPEGDVAQRALARLKARLARRGLASRASEAPGHYFSRAARFWPAQRKELESLGTLYNHLTYARSEPAPELARRFARMAREFRPPRVVK